MHPGRSWAGTLTAIAVAGACALFAAPAAADALPADVSVSMSGAPDVAVAGADLTYTMHVANAGPFDAQDVSVTTVLPAETQLQSIAAPGFTCTDLTCAAGTLAAGDSATITLTATVDPGVAPLSFITGSASATTGSLDLNGANDAASVTSPVVSVADLSSSVAQVSADPVAAGSDLTYRVGIHNAGPSDAKGARVSMPVPDGTSLLSVTQVSGPEFTCAGTRISCSRERLAPGDDAAFDVVLRTVTAGADRSVVAKPLAFAVTTDPDHSNDEASVTSAIGRTPVVDPGPVPDPDPIPEPAPQVITLGNAVEGASSGSIFLPVSCMNEAVGVCRTTVTITFKKPHQSLKRIQRRLKIESGTMSVVFMSPSVAQRRKIRAIRRLKVTVMATNPPGPPVRRDSVLSGHPKAVR